jgi:hypothetical protein
MASTQKSHEEQGRQQHDAADRAWGVMDAARGAAERAREFVLAGDTVGRKGEANESAWQQGQDVRRRAAEKAKEEQCGASQPSKAEK